MAEKEKLTLKEAIEQCYVGCVDDNGTYVKIAELTEHDIMESEYTILQNETLQYQLKEKELRDMLATFIEEDQCEFADDDNSLGIAVEKMDLKAPLREINKEFIRLVKRRWHKSAGIIIVPEEKKYPQLPEEES